MIHENLYEKVLIEPSNQGCDSLLIVSGYASATLSNRHLFDLIETGGKNIQINLVVGMCPVDGLSITNHALFKKIAIEEYPTIFNCSYVTGSKGIHSKLYVWLKHNVPTISFTGSANYTQNAFGSNQLEILSECDPVKGFNYYSSILKRTMDCRHPEIENQIKIYQNSFYERLRKLAKIDSENINNQFEKIINEEFPMEKVKVSLLDRTGDIHNRAGLNWGQRASRDKNQAYLQLSPGVYKSNFFPKSPKWFTVLTDDNKTLLCVRAQKGKDSAIHTPENNSILGEYFRFRLGVPNGAFITKQNLLDYGRTDVEFTKIDDETFFMDFSVNSPSI